MLMSMKTTCIYDDVVMIMRVVVTVNIMDIIIMTIIIDDADYEYIVNESMIIGRQFVQMFAIK